ncbi:MAG: hypothetical protein IJI50_00560 [Ruminococcus sp.]|nr:hypothetical protein [Ruminococcus sp.]
MSRTIPMKLVSCLLALVIMFTSSVVAANAAVETNSGKYVKDVFIAYGEKKEDADKWLKEHNWESIADLNDGKTSEALGYNKAVAVLGIQRTDDPSEAITDMAIMNMTGGYSFDDYENLVAKKKADITEFINTFIPAMEEYRKNYNGEGSEGGKKRAQAAHDLLNKFYDGDPNGEDAVNDTGKPIGDLLLTKTKAEIGDDAYNALSADEKSNTADLQQIILESSGPAVLMIQQSLALATDTAETSWLDRLSGLSGDGLVEHIAEYAPEVAGQDLAPSAAMTVLSSHFEDYAKNLAKDWSKVREDILWYEQYCNDNNLWQGDGEADDAYGARLEQYFNHLKEQDHTRFMEEFTHFSAVDAYYYVIRDINYAGTWGETLYDFFNPEDEEADYSKDTKLFLPLAAALSDGQRAALDFLSLSTLLKLGMNSESVIKADFPTVDSVYKSKDGKELENISIYTGINRAIFRNGVALTDKARMQKSLGNDPYNEMWDEGGIIDIAFYVTLGVGVISTVAGIAMAVTASRKLPGLEQAAKDAYNVLEFEDYMSDTPDMLKYNDAEKSVKSMRRVGTVGKWLAGIGGAMMILAAAIKGAEIYKQYHRDFSVIPRMIVDEKDIVTQVTDEKGNLIDNINFDSFAYYEIVKCNRQEVGIHTNAQSGVSDYAEWGCGDYADINADIGKEWLALYVNRAGEKGKPILASTFKIQKGAKGKEAPANHDGALHMFTYTSPMQLDDTAYCYRDDNKGLYLFWQTDANAYAPAAASAFNGGTLALVGIGGLALGILGTTLVMLPKRKKKEEEIAA